MDSWLDAILLFPPGILPVFFCYYVLGDDQRFYYIENHQVIPRTRLRFELSKQPDVVEFMKDFRGNGQMRHDLVNPYFDIWFSYGADMDYYFLWGMEKREEESL